MLPNPYALAGSLLLTAAVLGGLYLLGRHDGKQVQAKADTAAIAFKDNHLRAAARALNANARTFRAIDATTKANAAAARQRLLAAFESEKFATTSRKALEQRIKALAAEAEREKFTCSAAEMRICGVPLR